MTRLFRRQGNKVIMDRSPSTRAEFSGNCELCGEFSELRPYGPNNNENICFKCGMKNEAATHKRFKEMMNGAD